jgi:putative phage-type endonuclease
MPALTAANDAIRARNVTASEVGALLGPHPYTSALNIYMRLTGDPGWVKPMHTDAMHLGVWFERRIAQEAARRLGVRVRANMRTIEHKSHMLAATPDYLVLRPRNARIADTFMKPLRALIECKLSAILYGWSAEKMPDHVEWQARAQLAVTNRDVCFVAVLVGSQFHLIPVVREKGPERMMIDAVDEMENRIVRGVPPAPLEIPQLRKVHVLPSRPIEGYKF